MTDDFGRHHLVTKFKCSACGTMLTLTYNKLKGSDHTPREPTGASMLNNVIGINPCSGCVAPVVKLKEAMISLLQKED